MRGSGLQWSFSNTASASSQILSFKSAQERGNIKPYPPSFSQRHLPITSHHWQYNDVHSVGHPQEGRIFPTSNHTTQVVPATISSVLPTQLAPNGVSGVSSVSVPSPNSPIVGSTDLRNSSSISTGPCQLTIFYNGSVCVYDNVSPEKAQAIMLLAGNGDSTNSSAPVSALPAAPKLQPTVVKPPANDTTIPYQSLGFSSSISLHQPVSSLSPVASSCIAEVTPARPVVTPVPLKSPELPKSVTPAPVKGPEPPKSVTPAPVKGPEPPKSGASVGAGGVNLIPSGSAVPQARKASLARFLEKRKERVIGAAPYIVNKNPSECNTAGPGGSAFATNSAISPLPASN